MKLAAFLLAALLTGCHATVEEADAARAACEAHGGLKFFDSSLGSRDAWCKDGARITFRHLVKESR